MSQDASTLSLRVTVSGSFTRALQQVGRVVADFQDRGVTVLSPSDPKPDGSFADFVYVTSDISRTVRTLQERHFAAIARSDLLFLCVGDGQLGDSAAAEVHHANLHGVPVYADTVPASLYWRQVVTPVTGVADALSRCTRDRLQKPPATTSLSFLLDPPGAAQIVQAAAEHVERRLRHERAPQADDPELWEFLSQIRGVVDESVRRPGRR